MFVRIFITAALVAALVTPLGPHRDVPTQAVSGIGGSVHIRPVPGPIIDPFRPPPEPWLAGNRGVEFDTEPGEVAIATADGVVAFAGSVGGKLHVTIRHSPTLRTTFAFVQEVLVEPGQIVGAGEPVARTGSSMHFTARIGTEYIDPELLFAAHRWVVRLIPAR